MDFWELFNIKQIMISELEKISVEPPNSSNEHVLSEEQSKMIEEIKEMFPSFEKKGLGRTDLLCHEIDVGLARPIKQRYYPVSPIIQEQIDKEIDRNECYRRK